MENKLVKAKKKRDRYIGRRSATPSVLSCQSTNRRFTSPNPVKLGGKKVSHEIHAKTSIVRVEKDL